MSEKREIEIHIDPEDGYVLTDVFDPSIEVYVDEYERVGWFKTTCKNQREMDNFLLCGNFYRRKMTSEELKAQAAKKVPSLGTAYDGSPMDLDWFINSLSPLCRLDENSSGIGNIVALQQFVINLIGKKKDQQI